jgi:hypothetical protein
MTSPAAATIRRNKQKRKVSRRKKKFGARENLQLREDLINKNPAPHTFDTSVSSTVKEVEHKLLEVREPPDSLVALRTELAKPENLDISIYASAGVTFEDCLGRIAFCLRIAMDGVYDPIKVCATLTDELRRRRRH